MPGPSGRCHPLGCSLITRRPACLALTGAQPSSLPAGAGKALSESPMEGRVPVRLPISPRPLLQPLPNRGGRETGSDPQGEQEDRSPIPPRSSALEAKDLRPLEHAQRTFPSLAASSLTPRTPTLTARQVLTDPRDSDPDSSGGALCTQATWTRGGRKAEDGGLGSHQAPPETGPPNHRKAPLPWA